MTTGGDHSNSPVNNNCGDRYRSQDTSLDMDQSFEYKTLDRTHATLTGTIDRKQLQVMTGQQNGHISGGPDNGHVYGAAGKLVKGVGNDLHGSLPVLYYNGKQGTVKIVAGRKARAVFYTSPQSLIIMFSCSLT